MRVLFFLASLLLNGSAVLGDEQPKPKKPPAPKNENTEFEGKRVFKFEKKYDDDYGGHHHETYFAYHESIKVDFSDVSVEILHGPMTAFHENGRKRLEGVFKRGRREGTFTMWSKNGKVTDVMNFTGGHMEGRYTQWHEDGRKMRVEHYAKGKLDGEATWFTEDGKVFCTGVWKNGLEWSGQFIQPVGAASGGHLLNTFKDGKKTDSEVKKSIPWW